MFGLSILLFFRYIVLTKKNKNGSSIRLRADKKREKISAMSAELIIHTCPTESFEEIHAFLWEIYEQEIASYNATNGHLNFQTFINPDQFLKRHEQGSVVLEATQAGTRLGVCEYRNQHVFLLFTNVAYRHTGIARQLLDRVKEAILARGFSPFMTLNASPNAVPFYEKVGFQILAPEANKNGIRSTLMKYSWTKT